MKRFCLVGVFAALWYGAPVTAEEATAEKPGKLIFADDFNRQEQDEAKEEIGNGWGTNSKSRAGGHKQADLREGALHIYIHETADHVVSVRHDAEFRNGAVQLRFCLENPQDVLGLNFADLKLKSVHAGHLMKVTVSTRAVDIEDLKTGKMELERWKARKAKQPVSEQTRKLLATKRKRFPRKLKVGQWYALLVEIRNDQVRVSIDQAKVGEFSAPGFAHETKRMLRLSVPKQAVVDDLKIFSNDG